MDADFVEARRTRVKFYSRLLRHDFLSEPKKGSTKLIRTPLETIARWLITLHNFIRKTALETFDGKGAKLLFESVFAFGNRSRRLSSTKPFRFSRRKSIHPSGGLSFVDARDGGTAFIMLSTAEEIEKSLGAVNMLSRNFLAARKIIVHFSADASRSQRWQWLA